MAEAERRPCGALSADGAAGCRRPESTLGRPHGAPSRSRLSTFLSFSTPFPSFVPSSTTKTIGRVRVPVARLDRSMEIEASTTNTAGRVKGNKSKRESTPLYGRKIVTNRLWKKTKHDFVVGRGPNRCDD